MSNKTDNPRVTVGVRLDPDIRAFFEQIAESQGRSLSNVLAMTIEATAFANEAEWTKKVVASGIRKKK